MKFGPEKLDVIVNSSAILAGFFLSVVTGFDMQGCTSRQCAAEYALYYISVITWIGIFIASITLKLQGKDYLALSNTIYWLLYLSIFLAITVVNLSAWNLGGLSGHYILAQWVAGGVVTAFSSVIVFFMIWNTVCYFRDKEANLPT